LCAKLLQSLALIIAIVMMNHTTETLPVANATPAATPTRSGMKDATQC
jgi:hypothetical protein